MIIYHGSPKKVDVPVYGVGSKENDYVQGVYCPGLAHSGFYRF